MIRLIVVILVTLATLSFAQPTKVFRILPDDHHSSPPVPQCQAAECYNLLALLKSNILSDSISNITVLLYPGIHSINSAANEVFSISNATIFELTAANLSEGATIECTGNTGFAFSYCTNLTISGITFESCGAHFEKGYSTGTSNFVLLMLYSTNVQLSDVEVKNGSGIGLLAVNVHGSFDLSDSEFADNTCNLYFFLDDRGGINDTVAISVKNSHFNGAISCHHKDELIQSVRTAGVVLKLFQTKYNVTAVVHNITMIKNAKYNMVVELDYHTSKVSIDNITSVSADNKFGLWILSTSVSTERCYSSSGAPCTVININYAHFKGGGVLITNRGYQQNQLLQNTILADIYRYQMVLSNIIIENDTGTQYSLFAAEAPRLIVSNVTIRGTTDNVVIKNCNALLRGYQENHGSVLLLGQNKIVMESITMIVMQNTAVLYAPVFITGSYIEIQNSSISITNNSGSKGGGIILFNSTVTFKGNSQINFLHNSGANGGAMTFYQKAALVFRSETTNFTFIGNHANRRGGAIFVQDEDYVEYDYIRKITRFEYGNFYDHNSAAAGGRGYFHFTNNSAIEAGSAVYGGTISYDNFYFHGLSDNDTSLVSSVPLQICFCNTSSNSKPNCGVSKILVRLLPGQSYEFEAIAVGGEYGNKEYGTVPPTIRASFMEQSHGRLKQVEYVQSTGTHCT